MSNLSELLPTGGGQNAVDFVASGTLTSGQTVALKADGTVEAVAETAISEAVGSSTVFETGRSSYQATVYDSSNNKIVVAYRDEGDSTGKAVVGTVSGSTISFGSPVTFRAADVQYVTAAFDSNANKVVISYRDNGNSTYGTAIVGTVSGTSISFGTAVVFLTAATQFPIITFDSTNNKIVIAYYYWTGSANQGTAIVGTVSGTSISFGAGVAMASSIPAVSGIIYDSTSEKIIVAYRDAGNSDYGTAIVGTVSGTSISFGSATVFESANAGYISLTHDYTSNKVVISYNDVANSSYGTAIVGTVSGTSISFGTAVVFESASTQYTSCVYFPQGNVNVIAYRDQGNSYYGTVITGTVSGTSISFGAPTVFKTIQSDWISMALDSTNNKMLIAYTNDATPSGESVVYQPPYSTTNSSSFIGITAEAISDTATGAVNVYGGINEVQTGLTIASDYYVQADGRLAAGVTSIPFDISGATYASQSFNALSVVGGNVCDVAFKPDGLKMFLCAGTGIIYEYALSTAFDVSSASYSNTSGNISAQTPALTGISFSTSGAKMYALGTTNDTIYEFNLSTPWSVVSSSLSYSSNSFSIASKETGPTGVTLNPLGTKVYIIGYNSDSVHEFALSTAFDISSASFTSSFSVASQETSPQALQFNSDGTLMFICGGNSDKVHAYDLSSAYDISSSVYNSAFLSTASEMATPMGFAFNPLGTKLTVFGNNSIVYGYATTQTAFVTTVKAGQAISATTINLMDLT